MEDAFWCSSEATELIVGNWVYHLEMAGGGTGYIGDLQKAVWTSSRMSLLIVRPGKVMGWGCGSVVEYLPKHARGPGFNLQYRGWGLSYIWQFGSLCGPQQEVSVAIVGEGFQWG